MKAEAEWTARTEEPVVAYSASKRDKVIGIGSSVKHQGQRSYQTALTGRRHDCTRPAKLSIFQNYSAKRAPSRHDATVLRALQILNYSVIRRYVPTGRLHMGTISLTSRELNHDVGRAKKAAEMGPVVITDRGRPSHVLMTVSSR